MPFAALPSTAPHSPRSFGTCASLASSQRASPEPRSAWRDCRCRRSSGIPWLTRGSSASLAARVLVWRRWSPYSVDGHRSAAAMGRDRDRGHRRGGDRWSRRRPRGAVGGRPTGGRPHATDPWSGRGLHGERIRERPASFSTEAQGQVFASWSDGSFGGTSWAQSQCSPS